MPPLSEPQPPLDQQGPRFPPPTTGFAALGALLITGSLVAIVDDSRAFLVGWQAALAGNAAAHLFTSPEAFWRAVFG